MLIHGGDTVGFFEKYGLTPIDFSVNTNPLGISPSAAESLKRSSESAYRYPDPMYRNLRKAISSFENIDPEWIVCGNGAADLIWRIVFSLRPGTALITAPTFSEYESALSFLNCNVKHYMLTDIDNFQLDRGFLAEITPDTDIVFLCNPNNPTGISIPAELISDIIKKCCDCNAYLVIDECFMDFTCNGHINTAKNYLFNYEKIIILKAFTKLFGMAGLRIGYALSSNKALLDNISAAGQCWPVSTVAEDAAIAALSDAEYIEKAKQLVSVQRDYLSNSLKGLGLKVFDSEANYLFFYTDISNFETKLAECGILIRDCSNYIGLSKGYYRIAVLTEEKNNILLSAIEKITRESKCPNAL